MPLPAAGEQLKTVAPDGRGPVLLEGSGNSSESFTWLRDNRHTIDDLLNRHGGVLLRNFGINSVSDFNKTVQLIQPHLLDYVNRSTPRTKLGGKLYTATEYPADKTIPLHNESSYSDAWPNRIFFYSSIVAETGGCTPVADSRLVYQKIDPDIRRKFERLGVLYVRNYTAGVDLKWQEVFQTDERTAVEQFCAEHGIEARWRTSGPELTTRQRCQASITHPFTAERVWFNQAHLFHLSALADDEQRSLIEALGADNVPRNALYGDGTAIEIEVLDHIRAAYEQETVVFPWAHADIMLLDNLLFAHGRTPFTGPRKVVVAMG
jgi:alpha-ketoglutarate-dependent taurine dioxygenase